MNMVLTLWAPEAARLHALSIAVLALPGCSLLSLAAIADPLQAAGARLRLLSLDGTAVQTATGVMLAVQGHAGQISTAELGVILGGEAPLTPRLCEDLRFAAALGLRMVATGRAVGLLAKAGLLQGRRFSWPEGAGALSPGLTPAPEAFTLDGRLATCPDGPLAADVILHILAESFSAPALRPVLARCGLAAPRNAADLPAPCRAGPPALQTALRLLTEGLATPDPLARAEQATGLSRRQLERLFAAHLRTSPARHLQDLRLAEARRLLSATDRPVEQIARAVGFQSPAHFCRLYSRRHGHSPHKMPDPGQAPSG